MWQLSGDVTSKHQQMEELNDVVHRGLTVCKREKLRNKTSTECLLGIEFLKLKNCL